MVAMNIQLGKSGRNIWKKEFGILNVVFCVIVMLTRIRLSGSGNQVVGGMDCQGLTRNQQKLVTYRSCNKNVPGMVNTKTMIDEDSEMLFTAKNCNCVHSRKMLLISKWMRPYHCSSLWSFFDLLLLQAKKGEAVPLGATDEVGNCRQAPEFAPVHPQNLIRESVKENGGAR